MCPSIPPLASAWLPCVLCAAAGRQCADSRHRSIADGLSAVQTLTTGAANDLLFQPIYLAPVAVVEPHAPIILNIAFPTAGKRARPTLRLCCDALGADPAKDARRLARWLIDVDPILPVASRRCPRPFGIPPVEVLRSLPRAWPAFRLVTARLLSSGNSSSGLLTPHIEQALQIDFSAGAGA